MVLISHLFRTKSHYYHPLLLMFLSNMQKIDLLAV